MNVDGVAAAVVEGGAPDANKNNNRSLLVSPPQLTIFYNGSVNVYDAIPPEKAQAIMLIAAAAAAATAAANKTNAKAGPLPTNSTVGTLNAAASSPFLARSLSIQSSAQAATANSGSSLCKMQAELPIARRHSLQRFLEKRRDRLVSKSPYGAPIKTSDDVEASPLLKKDMEASLEANLQFT